MTRSLDDPESLGVTQSQSCLSSVDKFLHTCPDLCNDLQTKRQNHDNVETLSISERALLLIGKESTKEFSHDVDINCMI